MRCGGGSAPRAACVVVGPDRNCIPCTAASVSTVAAFLLTNDIFTNFSKTGEKTIYCQTITAALM